MGGYSYLLIASFGISSLWSMPDSVSGARHCIQETIPSQRTCARCLGGDRDWQISKILLLILRLPDIWFIVPQPSPCCVMEVLKIPLYRGRG